MAVTYANFIAEFPTFDQVPQTIIEAKITDAELQVDEGAFADLYDVAVKYLVAHLLTITPYGMQTGPQDDPARSTFGDYYEKLKLLNHRRGHISGGGLT